MSARWRIAVMAMSMLVCVTAGVAMLASSGHSRLPRLASREGALVIYSATDKDEAAELLRAFHRHYPAVRVTYKAMTAQDVYSRAKRERDAGHAIADLTINSAMDLQIKLANDGYAETYRPTDAGTLPPGAIWRDQAYAISAEPIVIGYNPGRLPRKLVPATHDALATLLHQYPGIFAKRIGSYDPMRSPTGHLYLTQDIRDDQDAWDLITAIGRSQPQLFISTHQMIDEVSAGRLLLAYNLIGSYAFERAARDPNFRVVVPADYTLVMSRVALILRDAPHPAAARLFLDFLLSREGQSLLAKHHMTPIRQDLRMQPAAMDGANIRTVKLEPGLMAVVDAMNFRRFARKWSDAAVQHEQPRPERLRGGTI